MTLLLLENGKLIMKSSKQVKQYAFWRYDKFPYVLGGIVTETYSNGNVEIQGYGTGTTGFKPIMVVSEERGKQIVKRLGELKQTRDNQIQEINRLREADIYHVSTEIYLRLKSDGVIKTP